MHLAFIIFMVITLVLLFSTMVLTAMAADDAQKKDGDKKCRKWSIWAAVTTGLSVVGVFIILGLYMYFNRHGAHEELKTGFRKGLSRIGSLGEGGRSGLQEPQLS